MIYKVTILKLYKQDIFIDAKHEGEARVVTRNDPTSPQICHEGDNVWVTDLPYDVWQVKPESEESDGKD